jgi:hypothetical protein
MKKSIIHASARFVATIVALLTPNASACDGLDTGIGNLYRLSNANTPYAGMPQVIPDDLIYVPGQRFGLYRWHITDPIRFEEDLKVTIQALGRHVNAAGKDAYLQLKDDISSVAYWYQQEPHANFPKLPGRNELTIPKQKINKADKP